MDQLAFILQTLDDELVCILAEHPLVVWDLRSELAVDIQRLYQGDPCGGADPVVILAVGRGHVYDTGTILSTDKGIRKHPERQRIPAEIVKQRLITQPCQRCTLDRPEQLILLRLRVVGTQA